MGLRNWIVNARKGKVTKRQGFKRWRRAAAFRDSLKARGFKTNLRRRYAEFHQVRAEWSKQRPSGCIVKKKYTLERYLLRKLAIKEGMTRTSSDRASNSLASVGRVSDHWSKVHTSWAEDYWHSSEAKMHDFAKKATALLKKHGVLKQVLVHDAGSGNHVHVAGRVK